MAQGKQMEQMEQMEQISVKNVPADLKAKAEEKARREQRPLNQVIRELLRDWVKQPSK